MGATLHCCLKGGSIAADGHRAEGQGHVASLIGGQDELRGLHLHGKGALDRGATGLDGEVYCGLDLQVQRDQTCLSKNFAQAARYLVP